MQLYALRKPGQVISCFEASRQTDYFCLECQRVVRLRGGHHKRVHFYHLDPSPSCRLNGKSLTHLSLQLHLQNLFSKEHLHLESPFPAIDRIADCFLAPHQTVFEIQCSPISAQELKSRIKDYNSLNINVIWIFHDTQFNQYRLSAAELFLKGKLHFYTNMDEEGSGIIYRQEATDLGTIRRHGKKVSIDLRTLKFERIKKSFWKRLLDFFKLHF